jgi:hypothetical protein
MPRYRDGGRITTSALLPKLFENKRSASTETKYYGLKRDLALLDLTSKEKALSEVLLDIQDPGEAATLGVFTDNDLSIISTIVSNDLKKEDFEIILNASVNVEDENGVQTALINPRQRISDRITQLESVAGRGTDFVGQGGVLFKYLVDTNSEWSHTNPPPFFTEPITSTVENAPDFIPSTPEQVENTHRVGYILNGVFTPVKETEWWWSGEYVYEWENEGIDYGDQAESVLTDPRFPIIKDGNLAFSTNYAHGFTQTYNWGLRIDGWINRFDDNGNFEPLFRDEDSFTKFVANVNGHLRIDIFNKTGYDPVTGSIQGSWNTILNTTNINTYETQLAKEEPTSSKLKYRNYFLQNSSLDLSTSYLDKEGNSINRYKDDYIPIIIRFWYGKPSTDTQVPELNRSPDYPAAFKIETISSSVDSGDLSNWSAYSQQLQLSYNGTQWTIISPVGDANFINFNSTFEIIGYSDINSTQPASIDNYNTIDQLIIATKVDLGGEIYGTTFSIPGISVVSGDSIWVIAKNRPVFVGPHTTENPLVNTFLYRKPLWQTFLFNPSPTKRYENASDLLEGVGDNYAEPNSSKRIFFDNPKYYQGKHGNFPQLNTYGPDRYDGSIRNSITEVTGQRDYDYSHDKLLAIGRQVKSTTIEPLATNEVRTPGENYTFFEFKENAAGFGGRVIINAYPVNNLGVNETTSTDAFGRFLNMSDNSDVFSNTDRLNSPGFNALTFPASFGSTGADPTNRVLLYVTYDTETVFQVGSWNGTTYTADSTGIIRTSGPDFCYLSGYSTLGAGPYYFHSSILLSKKQVLSGTFTTNTTTTIAGDTVLFGNRGQITDNRQYLGTRIRGSLSTDPLITIDVTVTAYNATTQTVTFTPAITTAGTYNITSIDYNEFLVSKPLPTLGVDSNSVAVNPLPLVGLPSAPESGRIFQFIYNLLPSYLYNKVDNGCGLSFGETLFANNTSEDPSIPFTPSPEQPFFFGAEVPAPPSALVTPFGYDNSPTAGDPGLSGICYPPYNSQDPLLASTVTDDTNLYSSPIGNYDVYWGGRNTNLSNLGGRSLTVTESFSFDFDPSDAINLFESIDLNQKPIFTGGEYTHKIELKTKILLPDVSSSGNANLINDTLLHSNLEPVRDTYYILANVDIENNIRMISPVDPQWS